MADTDHISQLVSIATDPHQLQSAQHIAAQRLLAFDGEVFPSDGCAITLSVLLQQAGVDVMDVFQAIQLGQKLQDRGWTRIPVGAQQKGDVGSTCGTFPHHGYDHVYLVLQPINADEMVVADNQDSSPHFRFASGKGHTPTQFFLRASGS
jgi:hypothetical protein